MRAIPHKSLPLVDVSRLKPASAAAIAAFAFTACFYFLYPTLSRWEDSAPVPPEVVALKELKKAEWNYQQAIEALKEVSQSKLESLDPALARILNDTLATLDYSINECNDAAQKSPGDLLVHRYLLAAYQQKAELMQNIIDSDSF